MSQHLKKLVYRRTATVSQLRADVSELRQLDKYHETRQQWFGLGALLAGLLAGGLLVLAFMGDAPNKGLLALSVALGVACAGCAIAWGYYKQGNTEDRRYLLLKRLLSLLGTDIDPDARLAVRMDLNRPDQRSKYVRKGKVGPWKTKFYRDDWLDLRGRFLDGTAFHVLCTELFQHRSRWKTSASGKLKHKRKTKSAAQFLVRLKPKAKRYQHLDVLGQTAMGAVQLSGMATPKQVVVRDGLLTLKTKLKADWTPGGPGQEKPNAASRVVSLMFLSLYQVLNLSHRMTKHAARPASPGGGLALRPHGAGLATPMPVPVPVPGASPPPLPGAAPPPLPGAKPPVSLAPPGQPPAGQKPAVSLAAPGASGDPPRLTPLQRFENLALAASLDGKLDPQERELLGKRARRLGLQPEQVRDAIARVASRQISSFHVPSDATARQRAFGDVVAVLRADGQLAPAEQRALSKLAAQFGVSAAELERALT